MRQRKISRSESSLASNALSRNNSTVPPPSITKNDDEWEETSDSSSSEDDIPLLAQDRRNTIGR